MQACIKLRMRMCAAYPRPFLWSAFFRTTTSQRQRHLPYNTVDWRNFLAAPRLCDVMSDNVHFYYIPLLAIAAHRYTRRAYTNIYMHMCVCVFATIYCCEISKVVVLTL